MNRHMVILGLAATTALVGTFTADQSSYSYVQVSRTAGAVQHTDTMTLSPTSVQPGGTIYIEVTSDFTEGECGGMVTSPGFVAPVSLDRLSHSIHAGNARVITKPGDYLASLPCESGGPLTRSFEIVGNPSTSPPKRPPGGPSTPHMTPVGPPQTGGGGTA